MCIVHKTPKAITYCLECGQVPSMRENVSKFHPSPLEGTNVVFSCFRVSHLSNSIHLDFAQELAEALVAPKSMKLKLGWLVVFLSKISLLFYKENPRCVDPPQCIVHTTEFVLKQPTNRIDYNEETSILAELRYSYNDKLGNCLS